MKQSFDVPENYMVVTSTYVVNEGMPILYVSHEIDGEDPIWQFHCDNGDYDMNKMLLISLEDIVEIDNSLSEISKLPVGLVARRKFVGDRWVCSEE